jgi:hypothetical protein
MSCARENLITWRCSRPQTALRVCWQDASLEGTSLCIHSSYRVGAAIYTPVEVLKCKAQNTREERPSYRKLIPLIVKTEGYRGLYRGFVIQAMREVPSCGIYFYSYEVFKNYIYSLDRLAKGIKPQDQQHQFVLDLLAGGCAGSFSWLISYPIDVIKTHI